ncbi:MAG: hypothetical protein HN742_16535 [Lentisphaerae bacterium]|jgi:hypothetical protein|nr:hypothetical protein [Lentisphaerota bacterium]MBT4816920.1 hypothetical protein [Lentisphaerota bacterium]MBT5609386.1 hypothetical protein [Lentisphaerota bacterium]MBT7060798.1 hypothetical protein [Lentisphaerota bacterium]MBT7843487.1 hypothetical protein [Lentisphaerota bacterium]
MAKRTVTALLAFLLPVLTHGQTPEHLKRSDVIFPYIAPAEAYRRYGATVVAWGFRPWNVDGAELTTEWRRRRDVAHSVGARFQARVELDGAWRRWIDFAPNPEEAACRSLEGNVLTYKFWAATHKGHPAYQCCTNSPTYREYLVQQAREALSSEPDMLLLDAIQVTSRTFWRGGCFCRSCVEAFRAYLRTEVPSEALAKHGIDDMATFDYGAFLRGRGVTDKEFGKQVTRWPATLPLAQEYLTFQHLAARGFIDAFRRRAEEIAGRRLPIGTSTLLRQPRDWWAFPVADHYTIEAMFYAKKRAIPREPIFRYKLADALNTRVLATGVPQWDFTFVRDNALPGLVRTWIAQAYAYGHQFMVPHSMWCGEGDKARYESKPGDCDDLYRFVRKYAELFDRYEPVAQVGVLYSNTAFRRWRRQAQDVCYELTKQNIPFRFVIAGDDWMPVDLREQDLADLKVLVVAPPPIVGTKQLTVLRVASERTVEWPDEDRLFDLLPRQVTVTGAANVTVLPRARQENASWPFVCHLLNGNYMPGSDSMQPQQDFTVSLSASLLPSPVTAATLLAPGREAIACRAVRDGDQVRITIPKLDLWAVLRLDTEGAPGDAN